MTFAEAKLKLGEIANGKYHSMSYDEMIFASGRIELMCHIYIDGECYYRGATWEQAFLSRAPVYTDEGQPKLDVKEGI